ncbi:MAG: Hpt domain-containing protein [Desulfatitalea sp.]|nr:Hpt domain-containing protein [Desulfatitalea sp.]NNJ99894.1 Hpt domain-containing protein [Desulfatitalea sp.]
MLDKRVIDMEDALTRALGDVAFLKMMFDELLQMIPSLISAIAADVEKGDMAQLSKDAHQFKGATASLGVVGIAAAAYRLECIGKSGNTAEIQEAITNLKTAVADFQDHLSYVDWSDLAA